MAWVRILALLAALAPATARAADSTVSAMTAAGALTGPELLYCVQGGADRKCTVTQVATHTISQIKPLVVYGVGLWYTPFPDSNAGGGGNAPGAGIIRCHPVSVFEKLTTTNAAVRVNGTDAAGNVQVAIYKDANGLPGDLVVASASMSTAAIGNISAAWTAAKQIGPGGTDGDQNLHSCVNTSSATATLTATEQGGGNTGMWSVGASTHLTIINTSAAGLTNRNCAGANCNGGSSTFGTWPASLAGSTWSFSQNETAVVFWFDVTSKP